MVESSTEKSRRFRLERAEKGEKEMRGIYVTDPEEKVLKPKVRGMLKRMRKKP